MNQNNVSHLNRDVRQTLTRPVQVQPRPEFRPANAKFVAKGHDAQLMDAQNNKSIVVLTFIGTDCQAVGIIVRRDRYTVTVRHTAGADTGSEEIVYKHAIQGILIRSDMTYKPEAK